MNGAEVVTVPAPDCGLVRHGIRNLSPSACNSFSVDASLWLLERVKRLPWTENVLATRGKAIEEGVTTGLLNPSLPVSECQRIALQIFDKATALKPDTRNEKQRGMIPGTVEVALNELRQYGVPDLLQVKAEIVLEGVPVPYKCVLDYGWSDNQIIVDLKTGDKVPGKISAAHARAGGLYVHNSNRQMRFAYASPKKIEVYALEDAPAHVEALRQIGLRMERFMSISDDADYLLSLLAPNYDDFRWNNPATRALGRQVFGY